MNRKYNLLTCIVPFKEHNDLAAAVPSLTSVVTVVERTSQVSVEEAAAGRKNL